MLAWCISNLDDGGFQPVVHRIQTVYPLTDSKVAPRAANRAQFPASWCRRVGFYSDCANCSCRCWKAWTAWQGHPNANAKASPSPSSSSSSRTGACAWANTRDMKWGRGGVVSMCWSHGMHTITQERVIPPHGCHDGAHCRNALPQVGQWLRLLLLPLLRSRRRPTSCPSCAYAAVDWDHHTPNTMSPSRITHCYGACGCITLEQHHV